LIIAFYIGNEAVPDIDFSDPEKGNPGTGAAHYLHVALPYFMQQHDKRVSKVIILAQHIHKFPETIESYKISTVSEAAKKAKELNVDYFIFRPRQREEENILSVIDELKLPSIGRAALTPIPAHQRDMAASKYFKALVCVGRVQYDSLSDSPISGKLALIENGFYNSQFDEFKQITKEENMVVFLGALTKQKSFHVLAKAWPKVIERIPTAKLKVIGSAKTYSSDAKVGPLNIASPEYEKKYIIPYLCDKNGDLHSSVEFLGNLGREKLPLMKSANVGVVNPTGTTETSCVSAIEFQAAGTPVVTGAYHALLDTVKDKKTGLLSFNDEGLARDICHLLENKKLAQDMGTAASIYAVKRYDFKNIAPKWINLCGQLSDNSKLKFQYSLRHFFRHAKFLRLMNRPLQLIIGKSLFWPSISEVTDLLRTIRSRVKVFIN